MTRYLLDTHSLLWSIWQPEKLGVEALAVLENVENSVFVSSVSFWEVSLKYSLGKLNIGCKPNDLLQIIEDMDFEKLTLSIEDASYFYQLPRTQHKDPFDRMLIWQALSNNLVFISKDSQLEEYRRLGLNAIW